MEFVHVELKRDTWVYPEMKITNAADAVKAIKALLQNLDREIVVCINMAASGQIINASICSVGTSNMALISPAEILKTGILSGANCLLMLHNHPSGSCRPSTDDFNTARRIATASAFMGMKLLDFIVIGADEIYSTKEHDEQWLQPDYEWVSAKILSDSEDL